MSDLHLAGASVAQASAEERALFLRKTYSKLLIGVALFVSTILALPEVPFLRNAGIWLWRGNYLIAMALLIGSGMAVRALARKVPLGMIGYVAYAIFMGVFFGPLTLLAGPAVTKQVALLTVVIFSGLTAYVFLTKQDFSFLRGILTIGMVALAGCAVAGWAFGWQLGSWWAIAGVLLTAGYILYDTSNVLLHARTDESLPAAIELFTGVVWLFYYLLMLFMDRD